MDQRNYMDHYHMHTANMHHLCLQHMNRPVRAELCDGKVYEGVVEHVDEQNVYLIIEINLNVRESEDSEEHDNDSRAWGYPPYGYGYYPFYGYGYPYGYGRLILPLAALTALSLL